MAAEWLQKSGEQGEADAQYELGMCYYQGLGVKKTLKPQRAGLERQPHRDTRMP